MVSVFGRGYRNIRLPIDNNAGDYWRKTVQSTKALVAFIIWIVACAMTPESLAQEQPLVAATLEEEEPSVSPRSPLDEIVYFVQLDRFENGDPSNDRGGIDGTRLEHGFDPTSGRFYLGGDLRGLTDRLDYIQGLGATAIRLGPIFQNNAVQGPAGEESSGYHGDWVTDFTRIDSHFGDDADMGAFVGAAHARGMKVYLDIITNHTADLIRYRECHDPGWIGERIYGACVYRSKADYPWATRGGVDGDPVNDGFLGTDEDVQTPENFVHLTDPTYAYTPFIPEGEVAVKVPAWLNDLRYYHNRGQATSEGESALYGDLAGLDDLMTSHPRVVEGFVEIYKDWITRYRIDGFHIKSAKHVNPEFWRAFNPATIEHTKSLGIEHFHIFGEGHDPDLAGLYSAFQSVVTDVLVHGEPTSRFNRIFQADALLSKGTVATAPTYVSNHDMGRFSGVLHKAHPEMRDEERLARVRLAHALMVFTRGVPVIYYGDEQGFVSDGGGEHAHEPLFLSQVVEYNDNELIATDATTADSNFDTTHPLYTAIAGMAELYSAHEVLRRGEQVVRLTELDGGMFAFSRLDDDAGEYVVVMNMRPVGRQVNVEVDSRSTAFSSLSGLCPVSALATGVAQFTVPGLDYVVCRSNAWADPS